MDNEKIHEQFRRAVKYRAIGFLIILLAVTPMIIFEGTIKYILATIMFSIGVYFERQYKCPACGYVFDTRVKSDELVHCPKCSINLQ